MHHKLVLTTLALISWAAAPVSATDDKKPAAKTSSKSKNSDAKEFKKAGTESDDHYVAAGKAAGKGGKSLGVKTKDGNVAGGFADFGKGMGKSGKEIGKGTAKVGKHVGLGVKDVFTTDGDKSKSKAKTTAQPAKK